MKQITKNPLLIKSFLSRANVHAYDLANKLDLSLPSFRNRVKYGNWKIQEVPIVVEALHLTPQEKDELFELG